MPSNLDWLEEMPAAVTVTDAAGIIVAMNARARETFSKEGGGRLVGASVFACHPEPARARLKELFEKKSPNHYTISKRGVKKAIHQLPLFEGGVFSGFVELSVPVPEETPHFDRG